VRALLKLVTSKGRREKGATLVEYALIVALVVGVSIAGLNVLTSSASNEVASTADCVSKRPQPASCTTSATDPTTTVASVPASSTTTTAPPPATTTTTAPPTTTTTAPPTTTTAAPTTTTTAAPTWKGRVNSFSASVSSGVVSASVDLSAPAGGSDKHLVVQFTFEFSDGSSGTATCKTNGSGQCTATYGTPSRRGSVVVTITTVDGAVVSPPYSKTVNY
jgi:Flp pilus assembly pilin Flp